MPADPCQCRSGTCTKLLITTCEMLQLTCYRYFHPTCLNEPFLEHEPHSGNGSRSMQLVVAVVVVLYGSTTAVIATGASLHPTPLRTCARHLINTSHELPRITTFYRTRDPQNCCCQSGSVSCRGLLLTDIPHCGNCSLSLSNF